MEWEERLARIAAQEEKENGAGPRVAAVLGRDRTPCSSGGFENYSINRHSTYNGRTVRCSVRGSPLTPGARGLNPVPSSCESANWTVGANGEMLYRSRCPRPAGLSQFKCRERCLFISNMVTLSWPKTFVSLSRVRPRHCRDLLDEDARRLERNQHPQIHRCGER